jgi:hypothetical protein
MAQKLYTEMTADEQLQWMKGFTEFMNDRLDALVKPHQWEQKDSDEMKVALNLIGAWPFATDFVEKALHYGDFEARAGRLRMYFERCKAEVSKTLTMKGSDGRTFALVKPTVPLRRRGRPSLAEVEARKHGLEVPKPQDAEMETQIMIARMMGIEVIVSDEAPREKNNAELAAERAKREAKEREMNPSLFNDNDNENDNKNQSSMVNGQCSMDEIYTERIENDRLHLSSIKWLCSKELQDRIDMVRAQRTAFGDAAQTAKVLAERGGSQEEIAKYAQLAEEAREQFESTYAAVDEELAVLHKRLTIDEPFTEGFKKKFKGVDLAKITYITRPYYEKLKSPELDLRIKTIIEQDSPEYAERMRQEEAVKKEVAELVRYIKRTDKDASDERVKTMAQRIERLRELKGDEFADSFLPILEKTKEDNAAWRAEKDEKKASKKPASQTTKRPNNQTTKKTKKQ